MDLSEVAVPHSLTHLKPLMLPPPGTLLEVGCGTGALAARLADFNFEVTAVDRDEDQVEAARERDIEVVHSDVRDVTGEYDMVLFTRSLHHADDLDATLAHAVSLLADGGRLVVEEFAWERVDEAAANFIYSHRNELVAAEMLQAEPLRGDPLPTWVETHDFLHRGSDLLAALERAGSDLVSADTEMLWRLVDGRGGVWTAGQERATAMLDAIRQKELAGIAEGALPSVGFVASIARR